MKVNHYTLTFPHTSGNYGNITINTSGNYGNINNNNYSNINNNNYSNINNNNYGNINTASGVFFVIFFCIQILIINNSL